ncbi:MAG: hypothetical protein JWP65_1792 [Ramlibacter sp.]|jgi:molybdate transport system substrate-binding protein|uniref:substrate-binding domain-containing protein n=1 Tax=Ramlibacter sp. TaxID=1917967 RepID=UPI00260ED951|nr:substrate-binding domain-containing protein [Ramlibacter sp.]MDB5751371.1 hypothetical protein [Ramlibacter sp.]
MTGTLRILSGGAAQGLVEQLRPAFEARHGCRLESTFGAVGLMKEKLLADAPCDLLVLTQALVAELETLGRVVPGSAQALGVVATGLAVKAGSSAAQVTTQAQLQALLHRAGAVYFPDPAKATAGIHFMKVLTALELAGPLAGRLRTFANGVTAMAALALAPEQGAVGCTQVTEILFTPGVQLIGSLPAPHGLATMYTAAVCAQASAPALALALLAALAAPQAAATRAACGFA